MCFGGVCVCQVSVEAIECWLEILPTCDLDCG